MTIRNRFSVVCLLALSLSAFASKGAAQTPAPHTWVSSTGSDYGGAPVNREAILCTLTAPCATLQAAIQVTAPNGIVTVIDPGSNYGGAGINITQSITIDAKPTSAGVFGANVMINAGPGSNVVLRGLEIDQAASNGNREAGYAGINVLSVGLLDVEDTSITGFINGIVVTTVAQMRVRNSSMLLNANGIALSSGNTVLDHVHILAPLTGLLVSNSNATLVNSDVSFANTGVLASTGSVVTIASSSISFCGEGIQSQGGEILLSGSTLTGNKSSLLPNGAKSTGMVSFQNNVVSDAGATNTTGTLR